MANQSYKGYLTVIGCVLIHIVLGTLYTCGNINGYFTSYVFNETGEIVSLSLASWLFSLSLIGLVYIDYESFAIGALDNLIGSKATITIGSTIIACSLFVSSFFLKSYVVVLLTFGLLFGFGCSLCYSTCISISMKWFPNHAGLISGIIVMGYGSGALIFNNVQTLYLNPQNIQPILDEKSQMKFYPTSVTDRLPTLMLILSCIYAFMLLLGLFLIQIKEEDKKETEVSQPLIETPVEGLNVSESLKRYKFWEIWLTFLLEVQVVLFISSYYKFIAQEFIFDDKFIALIGSISSLCNGLSRPLWGFLMDRFGYKWIMSIIAFLLFAFITPLTFIKYGGSILYMIWVCIIYFAIGGIFSVFPTITKISFGQKYFSSIYGFICTSEAVSSLIFSLSSSFLLNSLGYSGITYLLGGICVVAMLIVILSKKWTYEQLNQPKDVETGSQQ